MRKLRIALISEHASPLALLGSVDAGGQNVYVDEISRNLAGIGHRVDIFTRRESAEVADVVEWAPGVRIISLAFGTPGWMPKDLLWPLMPDFRDAILAFVARNGVHYDLIHSNFWMSGWVATQLRRQMNVPLIHIFHAMGLTKQRHQGAADTSPPERMAIEREVIRGVDRLIAQCPTEQAELLDDYGAPPGKVVVIPSAVNTDVYRPLDKVEARRNLGFDLSVPLVVYVGRMLPRKDVGNIVRAVGLLTTSSILPVELLLVGGETPEPDPVSTPEIGVLQRVARECGVLDRVHFMGKRQPDVLRMYYAAGDVAVTTPWYEPFGLTPLEAMACGRPVIGSAVGGITYTVADGETGVLVPPRDPEALAVQLERLLTHADVCERMGVAARRRVETYFTWPTVAQRTADLYQSLLASPDEPTRAIAGGHVRGNS